VSGVTFEGGVSSRYLRSQLESWAVDVSWIADFFENSDFTSSDDETANY
jgi:hypothetical protein